LLFKCDEAHHPILAFSSVAAIFFFRGCLSARVSHLLQGIMATMAVAHAAGAGVVGLGAAAGGGSLVDGPSTTKRRATPPRQQRRRGRVLRAVSPEEDMFDMSNVGLDDVFNLIQQVRLSLVLALCVEVSVKCLVELGPGWFVRVHMVGVWQFGSVTMLR
jgi:hypothetical protein